MKKVAVLLSALFIMVYGEHDAQESMPICMNWKDTLNMHWQELSHMHKLLLMGLVAVAIFWIVFRIVKCGKGGCGCHCDGQCTCQR